MADVFVSYARLDRERIAPLSAALQLLGLNVFFDVDDLDGGDVFPDVLDREVKGAKVVVGCWTPLSLSRSWVKTECAIASEQNTLVPLEFERLAALDVPAAFFQMQRVDMSSWHGERKHEGWLAAARAISRRLNKPSIYDRARALAEIPNAANVSRPVSAADMDALWRDWEELSYSSNKSAVEDLKGRAIGTPVETLAISRLKDLERPAAARLFSGSQALGRPPLRGWRLARYMALRFGAVAAVALVALTLTLRAEQRTAHAEQVAVVAREQVENLSKQLEQARAQGAYQFRPRNEFMRTQFADAVNRYFDSEQSPNEFRSTILARQDIFSSYEIDTPRRAAAFLAEAAYNTGEFRYITENVNYSAAMLRRVWPSRFPSDEIANQYAHDPEKLANYIYGEGHIATVLGNTQPGDGWRFRGRGFLQTTGRNNYARLSALLGIDLIANPDLLNDPEMALVSAAVFWRNARYQDRAPNALADANDFESVHRAIYGPGDMPYAEREYAKWLAAFGLEGETTRR